MNELTEREKAFEEYHEEICESCYSEDEGGIEATYLSVKPHLSQFFNKVWDLQQSRIDELVKALEKICSFKSQNYVLVEDGKVKSLFAIAHEALEKHKKYKEGGE
jgi:hypothetical protein